jgi:hypothetical protein
MLKSGKLRAKGMNTYAIETLVKMFEYYDRWGLTGNPNVLRWILSRESASFELFIDRIANQRDEIH